MGTVETLMYKATRVRSLFLTMVLLGGMQIGWQDALAAPDVAATQQCTALAGADFSAIDQAPTQIVSAQLIEQKGDASAVCQVQGYVIPNVGFRLQLPASNWNGKFFETGCGGSCGYNEGSGWCPEPARGYACIISDMGHRGIALDGLWATNNLQAQVDFGYRGAHVIALAGKAIAERYYGTAPKHSYFSGCSTGGRQALVEAQRFLWDFDGIIAGGLWIDDTASAMDELWAVRALKGEGGKAILSQKDLQLVHDAALAKGGTCGNPGLFAPVHGSGHGSLHRR
jgi:Tannase and feruloyl esterase